MAPSDALTAGSSFLHRSALTDLILEVFRLNGRLLAAGDRLTRPSGQTSARWQVRCAIDIEPRTVSQIAQAMGLARQSVQRTTDRLQTEGLVAVRALSDDQLSRSGTVITGVPAMTAEQVITDVLINHIDDHFGSIRRTAGR